MEKVTRTFDLLTRLEKKYPHKPDALAAKIDGVWKKYSVSDYVETANNFSYGLLAMGFQKGDLIATVSNNRPEWNFVDMGMSQAGVVHTPIYPTISDSDYRHILSHSEAKFIIVSTAALYERIKPIADEISSIKKVYTFDKVAGAAHWSEILEAGKAAFDFRLRVKLDKIKSEITPHDLLTIIYTSGTTGLPKGVMLSHENFTYQVNEISKLLSFLKPKNRALSFLPLCHVLERIGGYVYQYKGLGIYYAESIDKIAANLTEVKPHIFVTVPRLIEKLYDKILLKGRELDGFKKKMFFWANDLALKYELNFGNGLAYEAKRQVADTLIFSKWRKALGGNLKLIISGGAALQPRLARVFRGAGIHISEGYGLTETAPVIAVNHYSYPNIRFGTVGPLLGDGQVKIADDGEILFKGKNLMLGYYKNPEKTKEDIDADGWFHTGDIGIFVDDKFLKITDRKKEIFKTSGGKYIAPQPIENKLKESFLIEQVMVVGENEKFAGALLSPNFEYLHDWCAKKKLHYRDNRELIEIQEVIELFEKEIEKYNVHFSQVEKIKKFQLVCTEWAPESGELSPTLKLKRKFVKEKYNERLEQIYGKK